MIVSKLITTRCQDVYCAVRVEMHRFIMAWIEMNHIGPSSKQVF